MAWSRLDDGFFTNRKVVGLSLPAKLYHLAAITYCARELTDGLVPVGAQLLIAGMAGVSGVSKLTDQLVVAGLWECVEGGFQIHDYLDFNPSRETVLKDRQKARERMSKNGKASGEIRAKSERSLVALREPRTHTQLSPSNEVLSPSPPKGDSARSRASEIDDAFVEKLLAEYAEALGSRERVQGVIDVALGYKNRKNYVDQRAWLRNWVNTEAERAMQRRPYQLRPTGTEGAAPRKVYGAAGRELDLGSLD